jgi:uncharacterized membrane protein YgaE (UPF0421/DUF939 family)
MRTRWERVRPAWRAMVQAAVAVALAWLLSKRVWGHPTPFFAPVAAVIALGQSYHQRRRRAVEIVIGVSLGIAVADVLAAEIGTGVAQLSVAVFVAIGIGLFFGKSQLFVNQVAVSAVLVFTVPAHGITFARSLDALTGGTVAVLVAALVLPTDPLRLVREAAKPVLQELADTLDDVAAALAARDDAAVHAALDRARGIDQLGARFTDAAREGRETTRLSPARRRARDEVEFYADAAGRIDFAVRNVRVLARGAIRAVELDDNVPPDVIQALGELSAAVRALADALEGRHDFTRTRAHAEQAAGIASAVLERTTNLSVSVIVGQIRSTATDLLTGTGLTDDEAIAAVREATPGD